jgi:2-polyprenyl-3-methyl-5-hydroxy-6-metoxy-1,4-benzoquinol methylase
MDHMAADINLEMRARQSLGASANEIYRTVASVLEPRGAGGILVDVGCGAGNLWRELSGRFSRCIGMDAVRYDGLPGAVEFIAADLDRVPLPLPDASADVVAAVETIEHLENPRALCRELVRIARPGALIIITTPNQLSLLSILTLIVKGRFSAFQDSAYPAHRTALLEIDLRRIASESGLQDVEVRYTHCGRLPFSSAHYPQWLAGLFPRALSDNVVLVGRAPQERRRFGR